MNEGEKSYSALSDASFQDRRKGGLSIYQRFVTTSSPRKRHTYLGMSCRFHVLVPASKRGDVAPEAEMQT
jgi:hypothetical protein